MFGVNDFDETLPGPFEWDLKRLAASFAVGGRDRGFDAAERRDVNLAVTRGYREFMRELAAMRTMDLWYSRIDVDEILATDGRSGSKKAAQAARARTSPRPRSKDSVRAFAKLTHMVDGEPRIISDPPLITPIEELAAGAGVAEIEEFVHGVIRRYRRTLPSDRRHLLERFRYVHAARKVVGVGSVGTRAWIVLLLGRDNEDPLFLQVKEARGLGARAVPGQEQVPKPRPAGGRGPAADAGRQRHHARLGSHQRASTASSATSTSASFGTRRARRRSS